MVVRQPFGVGDGARQRLRRNELEHPYRVVRSETPQGVVEAAEYVAGVRVPAPPEVVCELVEPVDVTRKLRHRLPFTPSLSQSQSSRLKSRKVVICDL